MLMTAVGFFVAAALLGIILLSYILNNKETPKGLAFLHGPLAALGIVLLLIYSFYQNPKPTESIVLFIIAALGGFFLIYRDMMGLTIPKWVGVVHGVTAIIAFIFLLVFIFFPTFYMRIRLGI